MLLLHKEEIERYIELEKPSLEFEEAIEKGRLNQKIESRKALYERVKIGEVFAIKEWHRLEEKIEFKKRKRILNECSS